MDAEENTAVTALNTAVTALKIGIEKTSIMCNNILLKNVGMKPGYPGGENMIRQRRMIDGNHQEK